MYRSKSENIENEIEELKVEEEENILFGLKDQCENNFVKQTYQNQKWKQKEDSISADLIKEHMVNTTSNYDENEVFERIINTNN